MFNANLESNFIFMQLINDFCSSIQKKYLVRLQHRHSLLNGTQKSEGQFYMPCHTLSVLKASGLSPSYDVRSLKLVFFMKCLCNLLTLPCVFICGCRITEMGCFGLGVSRILQASVEVLQEDGKIRWPALIAPYQICIIPQMVQLFNILNYCHFVSQAFKSFNEHRYQWKTH